MIKNTNPKNHEKVTSDNLKITLNLLLLNPFTRVFSWYNSVINDPFLLNCFKISKNIEFNDYLKKFLSKSYMLRQQLLAKNL